jgi:hypothetical protein
MGFYPKMKFLDLKICSDVGHTFAESAVPQKEMAYEHF